jgi:hypothetical protein
LKGKEENNAAVMLAGYTAWAAVNLFNGFAVSSLPLLGLFTLLGMAGGTAMFPFVLGCSIVGLLSYEFMPWALLVAGMAAATTGKAMKFRITGFLIVASTLWLLPVSLCIPLALTAAVAALTGRRYKLLLVPAGFVISVLFVGLPGPLPVTPTVAGSSIAGGVLSYSIPELNTSVKEVLLPAPIEGTWAVWITIEAGGVRDSIPMMAIELREEMLILPAGTDTLSFTLNPGDTVTVSLLRGFKPFNHSAVHAFSGGELL